MKKVKSGRGSKNKADSNRDGREEEKVMNDDENFIDQLGIWPAGAGFDPYTFPLHSSGSNNATSPSTASGRPSHVGNANNDNNGTSRRPTDQSSLEVEAQLLDYSLRITQLELMANHIMLRMGLTVDSLGGGLAPSQPAPAMVVPPLTTRSTRSPPKKDISRGHLDRFCLPVLEKTPEPSRAALSDISQRLAPLYDHLDRKSTLSQIRKWFRKRREEMTSRLIGALRRRYASLLGELESINSTRQDIQNEIFDLTPIISEAKLEIAEEEEARSFAKQKLLAFLERYKPDQQQ